MSQDSAGTLNTRTRAMSMTGRSMSFIPAAASQTPGQAASNRVVINVGGVRYETFKSTLRNIPDTRLSWITESTSHNIDFDPHTGEYFFDRHPGVFLMILNYYRTGKLHAPTDVCGPLFEDELSFWGIDEKQIEPCCWMNYRQHRDAQDTLQELEDDDEKMIGNDDSDDDFEFTSKAAKVFGLEEDAKVHQTWWQKKRPRVWALLDDYYASNASKVFTVISMSFVLLSITGFVLESHKLCRVDKDPLQPYKNVTNATVRLMYEMTDAHLSLQLIEVICQVYFIVEIVAKFIFCPDKVEFLKQPMTWVDIVSILPFLIYRIIWLADMNTNNNFYHTTTGVQLSLVLQGIKLVRTFRIFKIVKNFNGMKVLFHAMKASANELLLLIVLLASGVLIFAVLIYYFELIDESPKNDFRSIPIGFWWAVVTMTTLGYGETVPRSGPGYVVGALCAILGVLLIALPVPVIVNNFQLYYSHAQAKAKLPKKRKHILIGAADALKQPLPTVEEFNDESTRSPSISPSVASTTSSDRKGSEDTIGSLDSGIKTGGSNSSGESSGISVIFTDELAENCRIASPIDRVRSPSQTVHRSLRLPPNRKGSLRRSSLLPAPRETNKVHPAHSRRRDSLLTKSYHNHPPRRRSLMPHLTVDE